MLRWLLIAICFCGAVMADQYKETAIDGSQDIDLYGAQFMQAAKSLIDSGECTEDQIKSMGGWWKSANKPENIYFTWCDKKKYYLDVNTNKVWRH